MRLSAGHGITLYVVTRESPALSDDEAPDNWQGHFLTVRPRRRDIIQGSITLYEVPSETVPGETRGPRRLVVSHDHDFYRLEGKCHLPQNSAECICHAFTWVKDPAVNAFEWTRDYTGGDSLDKATVQRTRVGDDWRPLAAIQADTARLTPEVLRLVPGAQVVEARYSSYLMGGGQHVAVVLLENAPHVLEWGDSEDGDWHHLRPMDAHNAEVSESNSEFRDQ